MLVLISAVRVTVPASASVAVAAVVVEEEQADNVGDEASRPDGDDQFRLRDLCEWTCPRVRICTKTWVSAKGRQTGVVDETSDRLHADREAQRQEEHAIDQCCTGPYCQPRILLTWTLDRQIRLTAQDLCTLPAIREPRGGGGRLGELEGL